MSAKGKLGSSREHKRQGVKHRNRTGKQEVKHRNSAEKQEVKHRNRAENRK